MPRLIIGLIALGLSACASNEPNWCGRSSAPIYKNGKRCATGAPKEWPDPVYYVEDCSACAGVGPSDWGQPQRR